MQMELGMPFSTCLCSMLKRTRAEWLGIFFSSLFFRKIYYLFFLYVGLSRLSPKEKNVVIKINDFTAFLASTRRRRRCRLRPHSNHCLLFRFWYHFRFHCLHLPHFRFICILYIVSSVFTWLSSVCVPYVPCVCMVNFKKRFRYMCSSGNLCKNVSTERIRECSGDIVAIPSTGHFVFSVSFLRNNLQRIA